MKVPDTVKLHETSAAEHGERLVDFSQASSLSHLIGLIYDVVDDKIPWQHFLQQLTDYLTNRLEPQSQIGMVQSSAIARLSGLWFAQGKSLAGLATNQAEQQLIDCLTPHFLRALSWRQQLQELTREQHDLQGSLDQLSLGVAVTDIKGRIYRANRLIEQFTPQQGLYCRGGMLLASPPQLLLNALAQVVQTHTGLSLRLGPSEDPLTLSISYLPDPHVGKAVVWASPTVTPTLSHLDLKQLFDLSEAESKLALQLLSGNTLQEAVKALAVSLNTGKSQLKSIFSKMGVHRQSDMLRRLWSAPSGQLLRPNSTSGKPALSTNLAKYIRLADGRRLHYLDYGDPGGTPVLMMHDITCSYHVNYLSDRLPRSLGLRIICPERPGVGESDPLDGRSVLDWVSDVRDLTSQLNLRRFVVLGYSAGMPYALAIAHQMAKQVISLAVVAVTPPITSNHDLKAYSSEFRMLLQLARYAPNLLHPIMRITTYGILKNVYRYLDHMCRDLCEADKQVFADLSFKERYAEALRRSVQQGQQSLVNETLLWVHGWQGNNQRLSVPCQFIHGALDGHVAAQSAQTYVETVLGQTLTLIADGGHFLIYSHWQLILERIKNQAAQQG